MFTFAHSMSELTFQTWAPVFMKETKPFRIQNSNQKKKPTQRWLQRHITFLAIPPKMLQSI